MFECFVGEKYTHCLAVGTMIGIFGMIVVSFIISQFEKRSVKKHKEETKMGEEDEKKEAYEKLEKDITEFAEKYKVEGELKEAIEKLSELLKKMEGGD